uniref:Acetyl-CoA synthetase-like protein n=1 Tax=Mycena chlorophos TaxID=658473 RepID=A0ABQ0LB19_MYCCL|nr:acetyl-CoA synthetase-like protein [Mycena chlorophos]
MKPALLFVHLIALAAATMAATTVGLSLDRIVLLVTSTPVSPHLLATELIALGHKNKAMHSFAEYRLAPGEGKTKTALRFLSSGTTGVLKMVALPHASVIANVLQNASWDMGLGEVPIPVEEQRFRVGDVSLAALPFFHIFGLLINLHYHLFCGMTVVIMPKFEFREFLATIKTYRVNQLSLVPPIMVLFRKHPRRGACGPDVDSCGICGRGAGESAFREGDGRDDAVGHRGAIVWCAAALVLKRACRLDRSSGHHRHALARAEDFGR